eukprot:TRINITY_DN25483_c0_g1_i1.p1 TRINITY_DN25483_c0_g1~~TRINITY_DN25483_c0_g1_i1.p1  ORF type:complete len:637 (+),score=198.47 TRINITY_DN25483_c0_g1_i1:376-2286(+)
MRKQRARLSEQRRRLKGGKGSPGSSPRALARRRTALKDKEERLEERRKSLERQTSRYELEGYRGHEEEYRQCIVLSQELEAQRKEIEAEKRELATKEHDAGLREELERKKRDFAGQQRELSLQHQELELDKQRRELSAEQERQARELARERVRMEDDLRAEEQRFKQQLEDAEMKMKREQQQEEFKLELERQRLEMEERRREILEQQKTQQRLLQQHARSWQPRSPAGGGSAAAAPVGLALPVSHRDDDSIPLAMSMAALPRPGSPRRSAASSPPRPLWGGPATPRSGYTHPRASVVSPSPVPAGLAVVPPVTQRAAAPGVPAALRIVTQDALPPELSAFKALVFKNGQQGLVYAVVACLRVAVGRPDEPRVLLLSDTALYQMTHETRVNRCVPLAHISEVLFTSAGLLGLRVPAEFDLLLRLSAGDIKGTVAALRALCPHAEVSPLDYNVAAESLEAILSTMRPVGWKPAKDSVFPLRYLPGGGAAAPQPRPHALVSQAPSVSSAAAATPAPQRRSTLPPDPYPATPSDARPPSERRATLPTPASTSRPPYASCGGKSVQAGRISPPRPLGGADGRPAAWHHRPLPQGGRPEPAPAEAHAPQVIPFTRRGSRDTAAAPPAPASLTQQQIHEILFN